MEDVLDRVEEKGELKMLASLVRDKILTVDQAAERAAFPVKEFVELCKKYNFIL